MDKVVNKIFYSAEITMSLEEARKVMWLRNNCRSLGELFDEGYLNQARLEWAAEKAYDLNLRQASKVLLDWSRQTSKVAADKNLPVSPTQVSETPSQTEISIEQARTTIWPFPPYKGQLMGSLSESKQVSLKDLGYAIENAWDIRVRRAAIALLLLRLNQAIKEPTPIEFLHVVTGGKSYAERQMFILTFLQGLILGGSLIGMLVYSVFSILRRQTPQSGKTISTLVSSPTGVIALLLVLVSLVAIGWLCILPINRLMKIIDRKIENYRSGKEGEDRVAEIIRQSLDGNWYLFRNAVLPGRDKGDMDGILVGPIGVWVLEIKTLNGEYRNTGDRWEYRKGMRWKLATANPSRQAEDNAIRLANFLKANNIRQWVTPAVIWANRENFLSVQSPSIAVWLLDRLPDELGNLLSSQSIPNDKQEIIVDKLTKLCQQQSNKT